MFGADVTPEQPTSDGRIDMVLKTDAVIYVFGLKYKKDADTAMRQIEDKSMLLPLPMTNARKLWSASTS